MAEFAYNNSVTAGSGLTLFYVNYGFHATAANPAAEKSLNSASMVYAHWMHTVHDKACKGLGTA